MARNFISSSPQTEATIFAFFLSLSLVFVGNLLTSYYMLWHPIHHQLKCCLLLICIIKCVQFLIFYWTLRFRSRLKLCVSFQTTVNPLTGGKVFCPNCVQVLPPNPFCIHNIIWAREKKVYGHVFLGWHCSHADPSYNNSHLDLDSDSGSKILLTRIPILTQNLTILQKEYDYWFLNLCYGYFVL